MRISLLLAILGLFSTNVFGEIIPLLNDAVEQNNNVQTLHIDRNVRVNFNISHFNKLKSEKAQFSKLEFGEISLSNYAGHPSLPYYSLILKERAENLEVFEKLGKSHLFTNILPYPSQPMPCRSCKKVEKFFYNKNIYKNGEPGYYKIEDLGDFRGTPLSKITFYPSSFSKNDGLRIFPNASFEIRHKLQKPVQIFEYNNKDDFLSSNNNRYLILTPSRFSTSLNRFINWKKEKGYQVDLITLEEAGSNFDSIKRFLYRRFHNPKTKFKYALIVGHEDSFPTHYVETQYDMRTPSDLYYFLMGDAGDQVPDVFYGRMVVNNDEDINAQTEKIIQYEKGIAKDKKSFQRLVGIASAEGMNPTDVEYMKDMQSPLVTKRSAKTNYFFEQNSNSNSSNINKVLNSGVSWVNYIGHGVGPAWTSINTGEYTTRDVAELKSGRVKPIIIDVACQNGRFSLDDRLGERFMNSRDSNGKPIGAVAYYGGSVDISWHPPAVMAIGITQAIVENKLKTLGEIILAGQMHLLKTYDDRHAAVENFIWYHLLGDPSIKVRFKAASK